MTKAVETPAAAESVNLLPWALGLLSTAFMVLIGYLHVRQNSMERATAEDVKELWKANHDTSKTILDIATNMVKRDDMNQGLREIREDLRAAVAELRKHG